jgi:hypothetical protein
MQRNVLLIGTVIGAILSANAVYMMDRMMRDPDLRTNDVLGYAAMVIVFSLIFVGVRNHRKQLPGGAISLGRAFKVGALIALVGSTIYTVVGLGYYHLFAPDFLDHFIRYVLADAERSGATAAELAAKAEEMEQFRAMYANPVLAVLITYMEVLPVGLVVAFVSALVLKRKPSEVAQDRSEQVGA